MQNGFHSEAGLYLERVGYMVEDLTLKGPWQREGRSCREGARGSPDPPEGRGNTGQLGSPADFLSGSDACRTSSDRLGGLRKGQRKACSLPGPPR